MSDSTKLDTDSLFTNECPDTLVLTRWLRGQLDDRTIDSIEAHIPGCETCQGQLDQMTVQPGMLRDGIATSTKDAIEEAVQMVSDAANGLTAVHEIGLVHRDIKPANILVCHGDVGNVDNESQPDAIDSRIDQPLKAKIADFGLAKF